MKQIPLSEVKNDLSKYLRMAEKEDIIITRHAFGTFPTDPVDRASDCPGKGFTALARRDRTRRVGRQRSRLSGELPMIAFHDFIPQRQRTRLLGVLTDYENLHEVVSRANRWIEQNQIDVLSVETVLMTSLPDQDAASPKIRMDSPGMTVSTYQIVRVWYRQTAAAGGAYTGETQRLSSD